MTSDDEKPKKVLTELKQTAICPECCIDEGELVAAYRCCSCHTEFGDKEGIYCTWKGHYCQYCFDNHHYEIDV